MFGGMRKRAVSDETSPSTIGNGMPSMSMTPVVCTTDNLAISRDGLTTVPSPSATMNTSRVVGLYISDIPGIVTVDGCQAGSTGTVNEIDPPVGDIARRTFSPSPHNANGRDDVGVPLVMIPHPVKAETISHFTMHGGGSTIHSVNAMSCLVPE